MWHINDLVSVQFYFFWQVFVYNLWYRITPCSKCILWKRVSCKWNLWKLNMCFSTSLTRFSWNLYYCSWSQTFYWLFYIHFLFKTEDKIQNLEIVKGVCLFFWCYCLVFYKHCFSISITNYLSKESFWNKLIIT